MKSLATIMLFLVTVLALFLHQTEAQWVYGGYPGMGYGMNGMGGGWRRRMMGYGGMSYPYGGMSYPYGGMGYPYGGGMMGGYPGMGMMSMYG